MIQFPLFLTKPLNHFAQFMRPPTFNGAFPLIKLGRCFHGFVIRGLDHKHFSPLSPAEDSPSLQILLREVNE